MGVVDILADFRSAQRVLLESEDEAAHRVAVVIDLWLSGAAFEATAGLSNGWRAKIKQLACDQALKAIIARYPTMSDREMARKIIKLMNDCDRRTSRQRPDGIDGYAHDLQVNRFPTGFDSIRKAIGAIRPG